ncbi:thiamine phosphate synthase [Roseibium algae]|uniref:Thiamine phosphate synthase n=1 Tax=Roseibium algae TaxID=3123038 RepID=A0ABU8TRC4_9HYPH
MLAPFYLIVDDLQWLERLCPQGLRLAQLRIKHKSPSERLEAVSAALVTARAHSCTLVINDHWETAIETGADWLHLGQEDLDTADMVAIKRAGLKLGISTHTEAELDRALTFDPDYVALGPIFPARGKTVDYAPQGIARLTTWRERISCPLIAIGGIRLEHAAEIYAAGAHSICVITDVLNDADPENRCRDWIKASGTSKSQ